MKPDAQYLAIIEKAHEAFKANPDADWDFPSYGGNITKAEIKRLSPEQVDAIQDGISQAQKRLHAGEKVGIAWFRKTVSEQYDSITPPAPRSRRRMG